MSPLDQGSNEKRIDSRTSFNPAMVPEVLPENFEQLGISHGALEKLFTRYVNSIGAEQINPTDQTALDKQASVMIIIDQIFEEYQEAVPKERQVRNEHEGTFKLPDGKIVSLFDNIDRQFYSVLPVIELTKEGDLKVEFERLKHPVRYVVRYDEEELEDQRTESSLQTMVLASKEAFEEMSGKISTIGRYLSSGLKQPNTQISDLPFSSYLLSNFMAQTADRLELRGRDLPDTQSYQISDIVNARRMAPNFFAVTVTVDHVDSGPNKTTILSSHKETHVHYAGIDPQGFIFTRWVNEHKADAEDQKRAA